MSFTLFHLRASLLYLLIHFSALLPRRMTPYCRFHFSCSPESSQAGFPPYCPTETVVTKGNKDPCLAKSYGPRPSLCCCVFQQYLARLTTPSFRKHFSELSFRSILLDFLPPHQLLLPSVFHSRCWNSLRPSSGFPSQTHCWHLLLFSPQWSHLQPCFSIPSIYWWPPTAWFPPWISRCLPPPASSTCPLSSSLNMADFRGHHRSLAFLIPHDSFSPVFFISVNGTTTFRTLRDSHTEIVPDASPPTAPYIYPRVLADLFWKCIPNLTTSHRSQPRLSHCLVSAGLL